MPRHFSTSGRKVLSASIAILLGGFAPCALAEGEADQWDTMLNEAEEALDWSIDPLADLDLDLEPETLRFWSASLRGGGGHSSNFLKRGSALGSGYFQLEGDAFFNAIFARSSLTLLAFAEHTRYTRDAEADNETIAFFHGNWTRLSSRTWSYGAELDAFYGDQIYDASLVLNGTPVGASLRQFRPEASVFSEWAVGSHDTLGLRRAEFGDASDDYWRPVAEATWERVWGRALGTEARLSYYEERYDEQVARAATGLRLSPEERLTVRGASLENLVTFNPRRWPGLKASLRFGAAREMETSGWFKDANRFWGALGASHDFGFMRLALNGRWQSTRYRERQVGFIDARPVRQTYRTLKLEARKPLPWNTSLRVAVEWLQFDSRVAGETFSERRVESTLEWTY